MNVSKTQSCGYRLDSASLTRTLPSSASPSCNHTNTNCRRRSLTVSKNSLPYRIERKELIAKIIGRRRTLRSQIHGPGCTGSRSHGQGTKKTQPDGTGHRHSITFYRTDILLCCRNDLHLKALLLSLCRLYQNNDLLQRDVLPQHPLIQ